MKLADEIDWRWRTGAQLVSGTIVGTVALPAAAGDVAAPSSNVS